MSVTPHQNEAFFLQYSGTPTQGHEELLQSITSPESSGASRRIMAQPPPSRPNVHINPKFQQPGAPIIPPPSTRISPHVSPTTPRTSPHTSPRKPGNTVHINPKFANRPLPSLPPTSLDPNTSIQSQQLYQNAVAAHVYMNASTINDYQHIYQNLNLSTVSNTTAVANQPPLYQNSVMPQKSDKPNANKSEPIYSTISQNSASLNKNPLKLDNTVKNQFIQSIQNSVKVNTGPDGVRTASNGVVLRNKYKKDNRRIVGGGVHPPEKPVRNSIAIPNASAIMNSNNTTAVKSTKPARHSVIEKPKRYSLALDRPKRSSVYVLDNRKQPVKPVRNTIIIKQKETEKASGSSNVSVPKVSVPEKTSDTSKKSSSVVPDSNKCESTPIATPSVSTATTTTKSTSLTTPVNSKIHGKENLPSSTTASSKKPSFLFTPLRKTPFKKIGSRKLIRKTTVKKSLSPGTPKPSFKRIGNTKLIRIRESLTAGGGSNSDDKTSTPNSIYSIKTKTKLVKKVKNTPSNNSKFRFSFITPLSVRKNRIVKQTSSKNIGLVKKPNSFTSRFKLDRREGSGKEKKVIRKKTSQSRLKKLPNGTYHVSATKLQKVGTNAASTSNTPTKPTRSSRNISIYRPKASAVNPNLAPNKVITVQGIKFTVADNGRKLKRLTSDSTLNKRSPSMGISKGGSSSPSTVTYSASVSQTSPTTGTGGQTTSPGCLSTSSPAAAGTSTSAINKQSSPGQSSKMSPTKPSSSSSPYKLNNMVPKQPQHVPKKTYIAGEEFDEIEPGVFTRSRHSLTRQSITQAKARSINTILKVQNRSKQYCMFYNKFGKCTKKEKGSCPYIHDASKIAVCRRFLQGACTKDNCLLSHQLEKDKMPACKYFLEGVCTKENCPYLHVKVSDKAGVCERFVKGGFCPNGADCGQRHVIACPEFDRTGACSKEGKCAFPHIQRKRSSAADGQDETSKKKAVPPSKPKRKSLGPTEQNLKKSRVATTRYYDDPGSTAIEDTGNTMDGEIDSAASTPSNPTGGAESAVAEIEERRQRILRKIEQAKQVWRSSMISSDVMVPGSMATVTPSGTNSSDHSSSTQEGSSQITGGRTSSQQDTSGVETGEDRRDSDNNSTSASEHLHQQRLTASSAEPAVNTADSADNASSSAANQHLPSRAPLGKLEDFISLEGFGDSEQNPPNDRLI